MSITDTKSSLKKILSIIEELNGLNSDSIPKLQTQPTNLLEQIGKFEEVKANDLSSIESRGEKANKFIANIRTYSLQLDNKGVIIHPPDDPNGNQEIYLARLSEILNPIYLENMPNQSWDSFQKFYHNIHTQLQRSVGFCFDVPHSFISNGRKFLDIPESLMDLLASDLGYIHLSGGTQFEDRHLPLDQGSLPLAQFEDFIRKTRFRGTIVLELRPQNIDDINGILDSLVRMTKLLPWRQKLRMRSRIAIARRFIVRKAHQLITTR